MRREKKISIDYDSDFYTTDKIINRVSLGSLAGLIGQGINIFRQVSLVPLFLWAWGMQLYGEWLALFAIVSYLSLLDFGMQMYVVNRLNQSYSIRQLTDYTRILHSALLLYLSITLTAGCLITVAVYIAPLEQWLNFSLMEHPITAMVALLLGIQLIFSIPQGLFIGLYKTFGEFPRGATLRNIQQICILGLTALILLIGGSIIHVAAIQLIPLVGVTVFVLYDLKKRHQEVRIGLGQSDWRVALTFLGPSLLFFLIQISNGLTIQGSIMVVSAFAGSNYVAIFAIHRTLTNLIHQIVSSFNSALWPELTVLEARGEYDRLRIAHRLSVKVLFALCVFTGIWLHFTGKDIIHLWTLNKIPFNQRLFDIFLLYLAVQILRNTSGTFLVAFNRHKNPCICCIFSGALGLGLALILVRYIGIVGVAAGLLIADVLICGWFLPLDTCKTLGDSIMKFWMEIVLRGLPAIVCAWIAARWTIQCVDSPLLRVFMAFGTVTLIGICGSYFVWLNKEERRRIVGLGTILWYKVTKVN